MVLSVVCYECQLLVLISSFVCTDIYFGYDSCERLPVVCSLNALYLSICNISLISV